MTTTVTPNSLSQAPPEPPKPVHLVLWRRSNLTVRLGMAELRLDLEEKEPPIHRTPEGKPERGDKVRLIMVAVATDAEDDK
jgi:hypothetical protein